MMSDCAVASKAPDRHRDCPTAIFASIALYAAVVAATRVASGTPDVCADEVVVLASAGLASAVPEPARSPGQP
jgi:hypothetical protein